MVYYKDVSDVINSEFKGFYLLAVEVAAHIIRFKKFLKLRKSFFTPPTAYS